MTGWSQGVSSASSAKRFQASVDELRDLHERTEDLNERAAIDIAIDAVRAEIANPKAPLEYSPHVANLNLRSLKVVLGRDSIGFTRLLSQNMRKKLGATSPITWNTTPRT